MLQATAATCYTPGEIPLAFDRDVRFATPVIRPLAQSPFTFKREHHQSPLAEHMDAILVGSLHPTTPDKTHSTPPTFDPASHQHIIEGPPPSTVSERELQPSPVPNSTPMDDTQPTLEPLAKKSHARKQPEGHIPRPRNAFILFRCDFVAQKKIPASVEPDHRNISRIVGRIWKAMSDADRRPWIEEAKRERERHKRLYPKYRYSPSSATTPTAATALKEKRAQYQKIRENMGVLPAWEVVPHTRNSVQSSSSRPTPELVQPQEGFQAKMRPLTQVVPSDVPWSTSAAQDCGGSVALSEELRFAHSVGWETSSQSQQNWSPASSTEPRHGPLQDHSTPRSPPQEVMPFETSSHFDSPDPSPVQMTQILPPFMFVAGHHTTNNPEFLGFHYSPEVSAPTPHSSACGNDPTPLYRSHPHDFKMNPENPFESPAWTADEIDDIIQNTQTGSSFDYASQPPDPFMNH